MVRLFHHEPLDDRVDIAIFVELPQQKRIARRLVFLLNMGFHWCVSAWAGGDSVATV